MSNAVTIDNDSKPEKAVGAAEIGFGVGAGLATGAVISSANAKSVMTSHAYNTVVGTAKGLLKNKTIAETIGEAFGQVLDAIKGIIPGGGPGEVAPGMEPLLPNELGRVVSNGAAAGAFDANAAGKRITEDEEAMKALTRAGKKLQNLWHDVSTVRNNPIMRPWVVFKNMPVSGKVTVGVIAAGVGTGVGYIVNQMRNRDPSSPAINVSVNVPPSSHEQRLAREHESRDIDR